MASRKAASSPFWHWEGPEYQAMQSVYDLIQSGGVFRWEREAAATAAKAAAKDAVRSTRETWLGVLQDMQRDWQERRAAAGLSQSLLDEGFYLDREIVRLRRLLGIKPSPEVVREQTRQRVRAYRQRQKKAPG